jgi:hypothetical protein
METAEDLKRLYGIKEAAQKHLEESFFKDSQYRPVVSMVRRGGEGTHDHGVLASTLGFYSIPNNHNHTFKLTDKTDTHGQWRGIPPHLLEYCKKGEDEYLFDKSMYRVGSHNFGVAHDLQDVDFSAEINVDLSHHFTPKEIEYFNKGR